MIVYDIKKSTLMNLIKEGMFPELTKESNGMILNIDYKNLLVKCIFCAEKASKISKFKDYDVSFKRTNRYGSTNEILIRSMINFNKDGCQTITLTKDNVKEIYILNKVTTVCGSVYSFVVQIETTTKRFKNVECFLIDEKLNVLVKKRKNIRTTKNFLIDNSVFYENNKEIEISNEITFDDFPCGVHHGAQMTNCGTRYYVYWFEEELK